MSSSNVFDAGDVVDMERRISLARVRLSFLMGFSAGPGADGFFAWVLGWGFEVSMADAVEVVGDFSDFEDGAGLPCR